MNMIERQILKNLEDRYKTIAMIIHAKELEMLELPRLKKARNFLLEQIELRRQGQLDLIEDRTLPVDYFDEHEPHSISAI